MRIHIIGGSGAGKSYIASRLEKEFNLNRIDLDKIEWEECNINFKKRKEKDKIKMLNKVIKEDNIIIEGVYYKWCDKSFDKSDYIFFLKTPILVQQYRILKRSLKRKLKIENSYINETLKSILDLLKWNIKYNTSLKKDIYKKLEKYNNKFYEINGYNDIIKIIGGIK